MDRSTLSDEDRALYELASLEMRATGIDAALAEMSAELARHGAAQILTRHGDTPTARMAALAWCDLWQEQRP